jgi:hypothetical protein
MQTTNFVNFETEERADEFTMQRWKAGYKVHKQHLKTGGRWKFRVYWW